MYLIQTTVGIAIRQHLNGGVCAFCDVQAGGNGEVADAEALWASLLERFSEYDVEVAVGGVVTEREDDHAFHGGVLHVKLDWELAS